MKAVLRLSVKKLVPTAVIPTRGTPGAAGYDLSASEACVIKARGKGIVPTGLAMAIPEGVYGRIAPRSGLAWKKHIDVGAGVIDNDYRGAVGVVLFNHGAEDLKVAAGDRVAQLILERFAVAEVKEVDSLDDTVRGAGGFGSTGVKRLSDTELVKKDSKKVAGVDENSSNVPVPSPVKAD